MRLVAFPPPLTLYCWLFVVLNQATAVVGGAALYLFLKQNTQKTDNLKSGNPLGDRNRTGMYGMCAV